MKGFDYNKDSFETKELNNFRNQFKIQQNTVRYFLIKNINKERK